MIERYYAVYNPYSITLISATYQSNEPVESKGCCGVVSAIVEGRDLVMFPGIIPLLKECPTGGIQCTNGLENRLELP